MHLGQMNNNHCKYIRLPDGRRLTYAEYGPASGKPVIAFHGAPGSRLEHGDLSALQETDTNLIVVDRPGYGQSDFHPDRKLLDWPDDICHLADALHLDRFAVMGYSGGGPYAAACGYKMAERITRVALLSSPAPFELPQFTDNKLPASLALFELAAQDYQQAEQQLIELVAATDSLLNIMEASASPADKTIFLDIDFRQMYSDNLAESSRQGMAGLAYDMSILAHPWGFDPAQINTEVYLWHGTEDHNVPIAMGYHLGNAIPQCRTHYLPGAGHYLMFEHWKEILQELIK